MFDFFVRYSQSIILRFHDASLLDIKIFWGTEWLFDGIKLGLWEIDWCAFDIERFMKSKRERLSVFYDFVEMVMVTDVVHSICLAISLKTKILTENSNF